jgi:hypothetical protein
VAKLKELLEEIEREWLTPPTTEIAWVFAEN